MSEITCMNAATCARLHRLGANACARCADKAPADGADSSAEPAAADENEAHADDYGNGGNHLYRIRLTKTEYYSAYVEIAADNEDDARERATECDDVDWEYDDSEWDYPTLDEQLS